MNEKVAGYILLVAGVVIMLISALSVYLVFTKVIKPVQLFNSTGISIDLGSMIGGNLNALNNAGVTNPKSQTKPADIIPADLLNDTSNLFAHVFLMSFLAGIGFKLSSLGVQLLRPIEVKLKAKDGTEIPTAKN